MTTMTQTSFQTEQTSHALHQELSFITQRRQRQYRLQQVLKRLMDFSLACLALLVVSPLMLLIAIAIKLDSPGPVFYKSKRIGKGFQPFYMYKFRTMRTDADSLRDKLREEANLQGELFKLKDDPRVTPLGKFLRAYSLDELPQFINVVRGEMSMVGPRPLPPDESELFEAPYTIRFQVFPGITGLWQVNGRSSLDFKNLCDLELSYISAWSLSQDIRIMFRTVPAVLLSRGAC